MANNPFKLVAMSAIGLFCSLVMAFIYTTYLPIALESPSIKPMPGQFYTEAELVKSDSEMKARIEALNYEWKNQSLAVHIEKISSNGIWVLWIPWLLVSIVSRASNLKALILLLSVPICATSLHIISDRALIVVIIGVALGALVHYVLHKRELSPNPAVKRDAP